MEIVYRKSEIFWTPPTAQKWLLLLLCLLFFTFCKSKPVKPKADNNADQTEPELQKEASLSERLLCKDFISLVFNGRSPDPTKVRNCDSETSVTEWKDGTFKTATSFQINGFTIEYELITQNRIRDFTYMDLEPNDYIESSISINQKRFSIDNAILQPESVLENEKINFPLTVGSMCEYSTFSFKGTQYIILHLFRPCNGSFCDSNYLFIFRIKNNIPSLSISQILESHPLFFENICFADINADKKIDFIYNFPLLKPNETILMPYSFENDESNTMVLDSTHSIRYSCALCQGEMTDTIIVMDKTWW